MGSLLLNFSTLGRLEALLTSTVRDIFGLQESAQPQFWVEDSRDSWMTVTLVTYYMRMRTHTVELTADKFNIAEISCTQQLPTLNNDVRCRNKSHCAECMGKSTVSDRRVCN